MPTPTPLTAQINGLGNALSASIRPGKPCLPGGEVGVGDARLHLGEVGAGAKAAPGAGQQDDRDLWVLGGGQQRLGGGVVERFVEGVERLGPVQREGAYPVVVVDLQRHGCSLTATMPARVQPLL